jgi:hypothetical protein
VRIVDGSGNFIGLGAFGGNRIAHNGEPGVFVASARATRSARTASSATRGLGIDLGPGTFSNGLTLNDPGDGDTGANSLQNFPDLATATACVSTTKVRAGLGSQPSSSYRIEFFSNPSCDPTGWGEGQNALPFLPTVTTNGSGEFSFDVELPALVAGARS